MQVCVDLLDCDTIVVVHHTDCGGQAAVREHSKLMGRMHEHLVQAPSAVTRLLLGKLAWYASYAVPSFIRRKVDGGLCAPLKEMVSNNNTSKMIVATGHQHRLSEAVLGGHRC